MAGGFSRPLVIYLSPLLILPMSRKVVVLSEKPNSAAKIASALSNGQFHRRMVGKVPVFEVSRGGADIRVVPAAGHLYGLAERQKSSGFPVFDVEWKPSSEIDKEAGFTKDYLKAIASEAKGADEFYAATDYDIEGEVIAANILEFACRARKVRRMKFSTLTEEELEAAFVNARDSLDAGLVSAGRTRHMLDFFWGISLSRALMHAIKQAGAFKVLSIGRVQGPALAVLARREGEIGAFISKPYWLLLAMVKGVEFSSTRGEFLDKNEAEESLALCAKEGSVAKVERRRFEQMPPTPFDLTTLQTEAYRAFGFSPAQTLEIAQRLYEEGVCSYPRSSSQKLPEQLGLPKIISKIAKMPEYCKLADSLIAQKRFKPFEGKNSDPAHPAIYPTGQPLASTFPDQRKLYDLIVKRFLSCFALPSIREKLSVQLLLGKVDFAASGIRTIERNWMDYYAPYSEADEVVLPDFAEGERVTAEKIFLEEKKTQPPKRYTQASLVRKLEQDELGTKATRASIIQTLFNRGYLAGKASIEVTPFGMAIFSALNANAPHVLSEELTRQFERDMDGIQEGKKTADGVIGNGKETLVKLIGEFRTHEQDIGSKLLSAFRTTQREDGKLGKCNLCADGYLVMRKSKFGVFVGCNAYPNCRNTFPLPRESAVKGTGKKCEKCGTPIVTVRRKGKRPWKMCLLPTCETKKDWAKNNSEAKPAETKPSQTSSLIPGAPLNK